MPTYKFTVSKPTPCPFSGLHHADGHLLVLDDTSLSFFAPNDKGEPGRQLTDPRPLKSQTDVDYVKQWLADAVKVGTIVEVKPAAAPAQKPATPADAGKPAAQPAGAPPPPTGK